MCVWLVEVIPLQTLLRELLQRVELRDLLTFSFKENVTYSAAGVIVKVHGGHPVSSYVWGPRSHVTN